jgi:superfamily II DNA or RNA helicase
LFGCEGKFVSFKFLLESIFFWSPLIPDFICILSSRALVFDLLFSFLGTNVLYPNVTLNQVFDRSTKKKIITVRQKSSIPLILRDMAPPSGSVFDPAVKWEEEKERRRIEAEEQVTKDAAEEALANSKPKKSGKGGKKGNEKKSTKDTIKASNAADKMKKDHVRDLEKLSNLRTLKALQETSCDTTSGKIHRMIKMLHLAVCDLRQGVLGSTEAECLDILWALEEMSSFKSSDNEIEVEKAAKKEGKKEEKKSDKKSSKKDKKDSKDKKSSKSSKDKDEKVETPKIVLSTDAATLKSLYKDGGDNRGSYRDSLKFSRKLMNGKENLISFQLTEMADRLPPLSRYNRKMVLEPWQFDILEAIDNRESAVVCAPTSSGKTILSTYTCKNANGPVLFVLPSEVLVWQVASLYYQFFKGNVTVCTEQITFQEVTGEAQVYIGTPMALERSLSKVRGIAGDEMTKGEREFMILDGGFNQFDYLVLDEVHTLNGPEGDALQRIIKACNCPMLALSATIGNASQLRDWFKSVLAEHAKATVIDAPEQEEEVVLKEHYARFINLQRYVVTEEEGKDGKKEAKLKKLHPIAAMTPDRLKSQPELISALSMTPHDMMTLWKRLKAMFPATALEDLDNPDNFFNQYVDESNRITLNQTKMYETRLKERLAVLSQSHPELYEKLRVAQEPPPLVAKTDVSDDLYDVVKQLKASELLPAVAFQLNTYGAFDMFKKVLARLESDQVAEFPDYRKDLIRVAREKAQMRKVAEGQATRVNAAEAEADAQAGFVDDSLVNEDTTRPHDKYVLSSAGKRLNFSEVENIISDMKKSGEKVDINHALIRGLRRGIAIYTNEVGFSCYRRQVQMLASQGRLAVVFSDSALAYGVNMPFRSCIFCGDMGDDLTPLIAQQMQGRAGRRGMDVQGNVIYLGMNWSYIENLMLGQISQVTGKQPRYPLMSLVGSLAAANDPSDTKRFMFDDTENPAFATAIRKIQRSQNCFPTVTEDQIEWMAGSTLEDFCEGKTSDDYLELSQGVATSFGYTFDDGTLAMDHNVLTMVAEMHEYLPIAVHLCAVLEQMYLRFCYQKSKQFKESDATQNEFLSILIHIADRCPPADGSESLQQLLRIEESEDGKLNEEWKASWYETEDTLRKQKLLIDGLDIPDEEKAKLNLELPPASEENSSGPPLDKGVYEMLVSKQKGFHESQSMERRNDLKNRIVRLGQICQIAHNNIQQPHGKFDQLEVMFRRMFSNIKYSVADMMEQLTDQDDLTEL